MAHQRTLDIPLPEHTRRPLLLDGGMGRELRFRGVSLSPTIWSASALLTRPDIVREVHMDYIRAGADIITTNTYGIIAEQLEREGMADRFVELNQLACTLAIEARQATREKVLIAGSLPPLGGSYRPDRVGGFEEIEALYRRQAEILAPHVDLLLCETMSSAGEGRAAAYAACRTGRPVWVAWTLHEDRSGRLRSGETVSDAVAALSGLPVSGALANCCSPESVTRALPELLTSGADFVGGYANTFEPVPRDWQLDGDRDSDGFLVLRRDLGPERYAGYVSTWIAEGANVVGGCCGTRPAHIAKIHEFLR